jgi:multimeric flavodoxin WrbA
MKTLVIFGSARKKGHTKALLNAFLEEAKGDIEIVDSYRVKNVSPCLDCRACWKKKACPIKDDMQEIYRKVDEADCIVLAAPMYFHSVPGPMKSILDRFQVYWAGSIRGDKPEELSKKGALLMVGGAPPFTDQFKAGEMVLKGLLHDLSAECSGIITFSQTDTMAVEDNEEIKARARALAKEIYTSIGE